jgi:hypothetical protein
VAWEPGQRAQARALETPFEDVPDHLYQHLWEWISQGLSGRRGGVDRDRLKLLFLDFRWPISDDDYQDMARLQDDCSVDPHVMLDVIENLLMRHEWDESRALQLDALLREGNSAYAVKSTWDGLELRITTEVKDQVQAVVAEATGSPGNHLANAWNGAYGRQADPVKSYSESIKAVEAALARHVSPQNGKQTLGTMIADIRNKPTKWKFAIDGKVSGPETVLHMMQLLWDGQTSRHAGVQPTLDETIEKAQSAVHLAAALVQFGTSGAFAQANS